jgi:hypothetical protein
MDIRLEVQPKNTPLWCIFDTNSWDLLLANAALRPDFSADPGEHRDSAQCLAPPRASNGKNCSMNFARVPAAMPSLFGGPRWRRQA